MDSDIDDKLEELHAQLFYLYIQCESEQMNKDEYNEEFDKIDEQIEILEQIKASDLYKAVYNNE